jgi:hypothetical protein
MNISKLLATAVLLSLAACAVKDDRASKVALHNNDGTPVKSEALAGGQPGKITVSGALVARDEQKNALSLKANVSMNVVGGKAQDGKVAEVDEDHQPFLVISQSDSSLTSLGSQKTYMVVGCSDDQVENSYTNGLEKKATPDLKNATSVDLSAKVVFVCGEVKTGAIATVLKADQLILNNVSIDNTVTAGALDVGANTLVLIGQNKVSTTGVDVAGSVSEAASLSANVTKEISGDGSLAIVSQGGNVISAANASTSVSAQQQAHDAAEAKNTAYDEATATTR